MANVTAYEVLGLTPGDVSVAAITQRYKKLSMRLHPDKGRGPTATFKRW